MSVTPRIGGYSSGTQTNLYSDDPSLTNRQAWSDSTAAAVAAMIADGSSTDYANWQGSFVQMFSVEGLPQLAERLALTTTMTVGSRMLVLPFVQGGLSAVGLTGGAAPFLLTALGLSVTTSTVLTAYNYYKTPKEMRGQLNLGGEFVRTFAYSLPAVILGMGASRLVLGTAFAQGSSVGARSAIDLATDISSEPLQALTALGVFHLLLEDTKLDPTVMTNWERYRMELVEGLFGLTGARLTNGALHIAPSFVRRITNGLTSLSARTGQLAGLKVADALGIKVDIPGATRNSNHLRAVSEMLTKRMGLDTKALGRALTPSEVARVRAFAAGNGMGEVEISQLVALLNAPYSEITSERVTRSEGAPHQPTVVIDNNVVDFATAREAAAQRARNQSPASLRRSAFPIEVRLEVQPTLVRTLQDLLTETGITRNALVRAVQEHARGGAEQEIVLNNDGSVTLRPGETTLTMSEDGVMIRGDYATSQAPFSRAHEEGKIFAGHTHYTRSVSDVDQAQAVLFSRQDFQGLISDLARPDVKVGTTRSHLVATHLRNSRGQIVAARLDIKKGGLNHFEIVRLSLHGVPKSMVNDYTTRLREELDQALILIGQEGLDQSQRVAAASAMAEDGGAEEDSGLDHLRPYEVTPIEVASRNDESSVLKLEMQTRKDALTHLFGSMGFEVPEDAVVTTDLGRGQSITVNGNKPGLGGVAATNFSVEAIFTEIRGNQAAENELLKQLFTPKELDEANLGVYRDAPNKTKFYSRVAGLLAMKAAIFRAARIPLPSETGGEDSRWTDISYAREAYTEEGVTRYRRVRILSGEVGKRLQDKGLLTTFADEGDIGQALAFVEDRPGASGLVGIGIDITNKKRRSFGGEVTSAISHARGEAAYKATYFGGQQAFYLSNIAGEVKGTNAVGEIGNLDVTGVTSGAMANLGGTQLKGVTQVDGDMVSCAILVEGTPTNLDLLKVNTVATDPANRVSKPALAQLMDEGKINVVFQFPGEAADCYPFLRARHQTSARARRIIDERGAIMERGGIPVSRILNGQATPGEMMDVGNRLAFIGLASELAIDEMRQAGYDISKATAVTGYSLGISSAIGAVGAASANQVIDLATKLGPRMAQDGEEYTPAVGETRTLGELARLPSGQQIEAMEAYSGKIPMIATLGMARFQLEAIVAEVNALPEMAADGQRASVSLIQINFDPAMQHHAPEGITLSTDISRNGMNVSGSKRALIEVGKRVVAAGGKIRALPVTGAYHSPLLRDACRKSLAESARERARIDTLPTALIMFSDGLDLRDLRSRGWVKGLDGEQLDIDVEGNVHFTDLEGNRFTLQAEVYALLVALYSDVVDWPLATLTALKRCDPTKPTIFIDAGPGDKTAKMTATQLQDAYGRQLARVLAFSDDADLDVIMSGDWAKVGLTSLPEVARLADPRLQPGPIAPQVDMHAPMIEGEYTGPHWYQAHVDLTDPVLRADFIQRAEKALNGEEGFHSEFLESLGYDPRMPLVLAAMTGNTKAELVSALAAERILAFIATSTFNTIEALQTEFRRIRQMNREKLREKEDPSWEKGAHYGANVIHGTHFYRAQLEAIRAEIDEAKTAGEKSINAVSIAFSQISPDEWREHYIPLLERGVTLIPLTETEKRWGHFVDTIYPETPPQYRRLLAIAPESGEGGGHNKRWFTDSGAPSGTIRFGYQLSKTLCENPPEYPWLMTGGQSTPTAIVDAMLIMALQGIRGGVQVGGIMQLAKEAAWPPQVKTFIAEAAAGNVEFVQVTSEADRSINILRNKFSDNMIAIEEAIRGVAEGEEIGREKAEQVAQVLESEDLNQVRLLQRLWQMGMNPLNQGIYEGLIDVFDIRLSGNHERLVGRLAGLKPKQVITVFRSYRTYSTMEPDVDPDYGYVLGGRSIRAMGQWLESMGRDPRYYLQKPAAEIFHDLRDLSESYLRDLLARAKAIEEAEQARRAEVEAFISQRTKAGRANAQEQEFRSYPLTDIDSLTGIQGVRLEDNKTAEGLQTTTFRLAKEVAAEQWIDAVASSGRGRLAQILRAKATSDNEKSNPIRRGLIPEVEDQVVLTRDISGAEPVLRQVQVLDRRGQPAVEIRLSDDGETIEEHWYLPQPDGEERSHIPLFHRMLPGEDGCLHVNTVNGVATAQAGNRAYLDLWIGRGREVSGKLGDPVSSAPLKVTEAEAKKWNGEIGAKSDAYQRSHRVGGVLVHNTFPLKAAWASIVEAGGHPEVGISYLSVVHSGQTKRSLPIKKGDTLTGTSRVVKVENTPHGREATIFTRVHNQNGSLVAEYETKFLGRGEQLATEPFAVEGGYRAELAPQGGRQTISSRPLYRSKIPIVVTEKDMASYSPDQQWLHTDNRAARRFGPSEQGVIAQGWLLFHRIEHELAEGLLGNNNLGQLIGFAEGTAVRKPVRPGDKLLLEADLVGFQEGRALLDIKLLPEEGGSPRVVGTYEMALPTHVGVFPGNASQKIGMARHLLESGNDVALQVLGQAVASVADIEIDVNRLATALWGEPAVLQDGTLVRIESSHSEHARLTESLKDAEWLDHSPHSSVAVFATSVAMQRALGHPPVLVAGHSLGQYTAACVAGAISVADGARLVVQRGALLAEHAAGKMAAVTKKGMIDREALKARLATIRQEGEVLEVANINLLTEGRSQVVISGDKEVVVRAVNELQNGEGGDGYRTTLLPGRVAYHSSKVKAAQAPFKEVLDATEIRNPEIPLLSIVTPGKIITTAAELREELFTLNASPVRWDETIRTVADNPAAARLVEYGAGDTLTKFGRLILPEKESGSMGDTPVDELFFGPRPKSRVAVETPPPPPDETTPAAGVALPRAETPVEARQVVQTPPPPDLSPLDLLILDLRLSSARVRVGNGGEVEAVKESPLVPQKAMTPSEFLWRTVVISMCDLSPNLKPGEITSEMEINRLGFDSLEVAGLYGLVRNRCGIRPLPTQAEVKSIEKGTVAELFRVTASYWNEGIGGESPDIGGRGDMTSELGEEHRGLSYRELLEKTESGGKLAYDLIADGKVNGETVGVENAVALLEGAGEAALASVGILLEKVKAWEYDEESYGAQGARLRNVKSEFYAKAQAIWEAQKRAREEQNRKAMQAAAAMPGMAMVSGGVDEARVRAIAQEVLGQAERGPGDREVAPAGERVLLEFDPAIGIPKGVGEAKAGEDARVLAAVRQNAGDGFVRTMATRWSGRKHLPWGEAHYNGAPQRILDLATRIVRGEFQFNPLAKPDNPSPSLLRWEMADAEIDHLANQIDEVGLRIIRRLRQEFVERGLRREEEVLTHLETRARKSLRLQRETGKGLPAKVRTDAKRLKIVEGEPGVVREESRGLTTHQKLDLWRKEGLVDKKLRQSVGRLNRGEIDNTGKLVIMLGGTGTIGKPTAEAYLKTGAHVWATTRGDFGRTEHIARKMRNENAVRWNGLRFSTGWVPNYENAQALAAQIVASIQAGEMGNIDRLTFINSMAVDDYGRISDQGRFFEVMQALVNAEEEFLGALTYELQQAGLEIPVVVVRTDSPNVDYALGMEKTYSKAKAANSPPKQLARRRVTEHLFYKGNGRPMIIHRGVNTGAVPPTENVGIMRHFRVNGEVPEDLALQKTGKRMWVFSGREQGEILVAADDPKFGEKDFDFNADGNFAHVDRVLTDRELARQGIHNGVFNLMQKAKEVVAKRHADASSVSRTTEPTEAWHPFVEGRVRDVLNIGFHIDELDGPREQSPYNDIGDDDLVVVGVSALTDVGVTAVDTFTNAVEWWGGVENPEWPLHAGMALTANALGYNINDLRFGEIVARHGRDVYENLGPRLLREGQTHTADHYPQFELFRGEDRVDLGTQEEVVASQRATKGEGIALKSRIGRLAKEGYQFVREGDRVIAVKKDAHLARTVIGESRPRIWGHIPNIDFEAHGADKAWVRGEARHVAMAAWAQSGAYRGAGMTPRAVRARHGAENIIDVTSFGLGSTHLTARQKQAPQRGEVAPGGDTVYGIGAAAAGQKQAVISGGRGPTLEVQNACNTGIATVYVTVRDMKANFKRADDARKALERAVERNTDAATVAALEAEYERLLTKARLSVGFAVSADDAGSVETARLFDTVGAMVTQGEAEAKEFPDTRQQRPHDKARIPKFQAGDGAGAMMIVTGWALKQFGGTPLAVIRGIKSGGDGTLRGPDGHLRAPTGIGRFGQEHVFFESFREARIAGLPPEAVEQVNSHSTGTGSDPVQVLSFAIAQTMEVVDWGVKQLALAPDVAKKRYPHLNAYLAEKKVTPAQLAKIAWEEGGQVLALGFSYLKPEEMLAQLLALPDDLLDELGLNRLTIDNHLKGMGLRHTMGGTEVEGVLAIVQVTHNRTMPLPGLNNLINETAQNPTAHTLSDSVDTSAIHEPLPRYSTPPSQVRNKPKGASQNSFGFNGLDGSVVFEIPKGLNFSTVAKATRWWKNTLGIEATAIALNRAPLDGTMSWIMGAEDEGVGAQDYSDTKKAFDQAEHYARRIVERDPDIHLPWEIAWKEKQRPAENGEPLPSP